ncbi:MAG: lipoate-protein ligase B [Bacteriovoracaceae bacterium]|jgi:lipoate-protein ligase B
MNLKTENWGLSPYAESEQRQSSLVDAIAKGLEEERLIICSHPSVVTLGKQSSESDMAGWEGEVHKISRGGKATYHGPGQVVMYPLIHLQKRVGDLHKFLDHLERSMILTLKDYQIEAHGNLDRGNPDGTGVWVDGKKIASIGIACRRWVTYHGLALNLYKDPKAFTGINPCGFDAQIMTSLEELLDQKVSREEFEIKLASHLLNFLRQ